MKMTCLSMKEKICPRIMRIGSLVRIPKIAHGNLCVCLKRLTVLMHWDAWEMKEAFKRIKDGEIVGKWPKIPLTGA
jgi:hypothetical protein